MKNNERLQALKILTSVLTEHLTLSQLMPSSAQISPMTKEICFGVCRHYLRLEAIADVLVDKRPKSMALWLALLMGLYQLQYMNQPDYAVVKETVALLDKTKNTWAKGLVNAVLRTFCRKKEDILGQLINNPDFIYGHPEFLLKHFKKDWPSDWTAIVQANDAHPPMTLRVNINKCSTDHYLHLLEQAGIAAQKHPVAAQGITLLTPCDVYQLPGFSEGWVSVQDAAAQLAATLLDLKKGARVLDACCAPGGKTCHILECEPDLAECVALDIDAKRLKRVKDNLARYGAAVHLVQGDALHPSQWWDNQLFDRILLDAPCSATGVIRRHADIKLLRTDEEIETIVKIQHKLLRSLWPLLAPGGRMLYATCSIISEENEQQLAAFVAAHSDCTALPIDLACGRATGHGRQILPAEQGMDGFFYAVLHKH